MKYRIRTRHSSPFLWFQLNTCVTWKDLLLGVRRSEQHTRQQTAPMVRMLFSHHPWVMQNRSRCVTRAVTPKTKSTEVQHHRDRNQIMKLCDKVHSIQQMYYFCTCKAVIHSKLDMAPETVLKDFFFKKKVLVATLLKKNETLLITT